LIEYKEFFPEFQILFQKQHDWLSIIQRGDDMEKLILISVLASRGKYNLIQVIGAMMSTRDHKQHKP